MLYIVVRLIDSLILTCQNVFFKKKLTYYLNNKYIWILSSISNRHLRNMIAQTFVAEVNDSAGSSLVKTSDYTLYIYYRSIIFIPTYVCVCVCMYVCMYVCMHVCMSPFNTGGGSSTENLVGDSKKWQPPPLELIFYFIYTQIQLIFHEKTLFIRFIQIICPWSVNKNSIPLRLTNFNSPLSQQNSIPPPQIVPTSPPPGLHFMRWVSVNVLWKL